MYIIYKRNDKNELIPVDSLVPDGDSYLRDSKDRIYAVSNIISITKMQPKGFNKAKLGKNKKITTIITPFEINPTRPWSTKWGRMEAEISAGLLVKFAQHNGSWRDFTKEELDEWAKEDFWFNGIVNGTDIILNNNNTYSFTNAFIEECHKRNAVKS